MSGNYDVKFTEWVMPQLGQRTRDPIQHADGSIWYAGQYGNLIGRLDPRTGQAKEYKLPANSMPHTVQLDNDGIPWFSGNKNGTVGKIDPATGEATVYKMPDPKSDPHTLAFNKDGILFFSFQASNLIGRLNPKTGELKVVSAPNPKSQPYDVRDRRRRDRVGLVQCARLLPQGRPGDDGSHRDPVPAGRVDAALRSSRPTA